MLHALLDAARMGAAMHTAKEMTQAFSCLYKGQSAEQLVDVAPFLFRVSDQKPLASWLLEQGWGQSWGVYLESAATPAEVYRHFRRFLLVRTEGGQELYFRFYDPRALRQFLPTCTTDQLTAFFGPVRYFLLEDENPAFALRYWHQAGTLRQERIDRAGAEQIIQC